MTKQQKQAYAAKYNAKKLPFVTLEVTQEQAQIISGLTKVEMVEAQGRYQEGFRLKNNSVMDSALDHLSNLAKILNRIDAHA